MAITEERLETVDEIGTTEAPTVRSSSDRIPSVRRPISRALAVRLSVAWLVLFGSMMVLEPQPTNPNAPVPFWANLLLIGFTGALGATVFGLARREFWGLRASVWAGGFGLAIAAACAVTDHHPGLWWGYEMVVFGGLTAFSVLTSRVARTN